MNAQSAHDVMEELRRAMKSDEIQILIVPVAIGPHREAVKVKCRNGSGRWTNVGKFIFPPVLDGTTADTVAMLMEWRQESVAVAPADRSSA